MQDAIFKTYVKGIWCVQCPELIISGLLQQRGVIDADVAYFKSLVSVKYDPAIVTEEQMRERLMELGCDGVKFIQMKPDRRKPIGKGIDHPSYDAAFSMMEADGTPVTIHSGDPQSHWDINQISEYGLKHGWYYGDGTFPTCEEIYSEDFAMLDKHPKLNVTFAHFFFLSEQPDRVRRIFEKYPNVKFDLTQHQP